MTVPDLCDEHESNLKLLDPDFSHFGGRQRFAGQVVTLRCFEDNSLVRSTLEKDGADKVLVVDGSGSMRCALLGDQLGALAVKNGWQGILVNGCVRDVEELAELDLAVMALAPNPFRSEKKGEGEIDPPVRFSGVSFRAGQYVYGDANGVVIAEKELDVKFD